jgi:hypothetical protein
LTACGAILDLPDPTVNADFNSSDGSSGTNDGQTTLPDGSLVDGALEDGFVPPTDSGTDAKVSPDDAALCGGKDCFGGPCNTGNVCGAIAIATVTDPKYLAYDNDQLFVTSGQTTIYNIDVKNYSSRAITTSESDLVAITARAGFVYFASSDLSETTGSEHLSRCAEADCSSRINYTTSTNRPIGGIAVDAMNVYYSQSETTAKNGGIFKCGVNVASGCTNLDPVAYPGALHLDGTNLYWVSGMPTNAGFSSSTTAGSSLITGNGNSSITDFTTFEGNIYFTTSETVHKAAEPGSAADEFPLITTGFANIAIATDGTSVYWIDNTSGATAILYTCEISSCAVGTPLVTGLKDPVTGGLLVTDDSIYYTTQGDGNVWRLAK